VEDGVEDDDEEDDVEDDDEEDGSVADAGLTVGLLELAEMRRRGVPIQQMD